MANVTGARTSYGFRVAVGTSDSENENLDLSSELDVLNPLENPLFTRIGADSLRDPCTNVIHEWLEDEVMGIYATTTDTDLNNTSTGSTTLTVGTAEGFKFRGQTNDYDGPQDIVRISSGAGEELARVISSTTTTVVVERGYNSVTPIDHTGYTTRYITIVGSAQIQGLTVPGASRTTTKAHLYNYTQIFEDTYTASRTQQNSKRFTKQDDLAYQMNNITIRNKNIMGNALLFGKRQALAAQDPGLMSGIRTYVTTNVYNKSGVALTETHVNDALQAVWTAGGGSGTRLMVVPPTQKRRINTFLDGWRQMDYHDARLGSFVTRWESDFGSLDILMDKNVPDSEVLILDTSRIGFGPLTGSAWGASHIAPTSRESDTWQFTGEYTAEVRQEKAHARIYGLSTTL